LRKLEKFFTSAGLKFYRGFIVEKNIDPSQIDHSSINSILLVIRHRMGDMLCSVPMIESIRSKYPDSNIRLVTKKSANFEEIYRGCKMPVDEVIYYEKGIENYLNLIKSLQLNIIDLAIVPSTVVFSGTNHLIGYHSKAKIAAGVKSKDYEKNPVWYLLNVKKDFQWDIKKTHQVERNLDIIRQLGINPSIANINLPVSDECSAYAENFYRENFPDSTRMVIGFHPGAGKEANVWPQEKFAELALILLKNYNCYFMISEGPADEKYVRQLIKLLTEKYSITDFAIHKNSLAHNAAVINRLKMFITNDTGIMHVASGLKTPLAALFGETFAWEWGPIGENKYSIQSPNARINGIDVETVHKICKLVLDK